MSERTWTQYKAEEVNRMESELASLRSQLQQRDAELKEWRSTDWAARLKKLSDENSVLLEARTVAQEAVKQRDAQLAELHSQAIEWTHQRMEIVSQLSERDGMVLELTEAIRKVNICCKCWETNGHLLAVRSSTSTAAADARRRVEQKALREAADRLSTSAFPRDWMPALNSIVKSLNRRADSL